MSGIAVKGLDSAGGTQLGGGQSWFKVQGQFVILLGDPVQPHPPAPPHNPVPPTMVQASSWMKINGVRVCRAGNQASCGHATSGRSWFNIAG